MGVAPDNPMLAGMQLVMLTAMLAGMLISPLYRFLPEV